ncbi:MAG: GntG family PLP-dependent aldolase [Chloroherpetonaceae bacterium]|nr:GntG family PLP-dependent aldolase [Chloroherpetonaceae bacterium]
MIDLRSDTVTKPSKELLLKIFNEESLGTLLDSIGDDVFAEDKATTACEAFVADLLGKESALFVTSGTMANQLGVRVNTNEGDEVIVEAESHIFHYETAAPAVLSRVQLSPVKGENGILTAEMIKSALRPKADWYPSPALICLENTHNRAGGRILPLDGIAAISELAKRHNLKMHLDGARLWNASVASGISVKEYAKHFDTVSVCFSKGLGAPIGSIFAGSKEAIAKARRIRKMWGGGMRQSGIIATMAKKSLEENYQALKNDHENAQKLAAAFSANSCFQIDLSSVETNIVAVDVSRCENREAGVIDYFKKNEVLVSSIKPGMIRLVTHKDFSNVMIQTVCRLIQSYPSI